MTECRILDLPLAGPRQTHFAPPLYPGGECRHSNPLISIERAGYCRPIIYDETKWRRPNGVDCADGGRKNLIVSRWQGADPAEHSFEISGAYHILAIAHRQTRCSLSLGPKFFPSLELARGAVQITPPEVPARIAHFRPYDILHFHIPNLLLMECFKWSQGKWPSGGIVLRDPHPEPNDVLLGLGATLLSIAGTSDSDACLFADFLGLAIVTRIVASYGDVAAPVIRKTLALPRWRLKRALDYIEAHLDRVMALADIADAVGLSRMHFAAQFRAATGLRPHEYVLRRRIENAQIKLATTDTPIAELALDVGFSSQSHFTVVFKRFSGLPPHQWRQTHRC